MLRFYFEVARTAFRRQLIYRWANLAGLCTNVFFAAILGYVVIALYRARPVVAGYDVLDTLRYTWLVQAMLMVVLPFGWYDLMLTIRSGEVVSDLSKPCDFYWYWFSRAMGQSFYYFIFRCIPIYVGGMLLFGLGLPGRWYDWLAYGLVFPLGVILGVAYRFMYNIVAFWIIEARAIVTLAVTIGLFFTGSYVPLPLLPPWLHTIADWLPFNGFMNLPTEVLLDKIAMNTLWLEVSKQVFWLFVLTGIARWLTVSATKRVISQGG